MKMHLRFVWLAALVGLTPLCGNVVRDRYVAAELVAEKTALVPGQATTVALRLQHDEHWHTYWKNPGEAGLPTTIAWTLPAGFSAGPIQWPAPQILVTSGIYNYGYEGEVFLLVDLAVPPNAAVGASVTLQAKVDWLMCKESCVPGAAQLTLTLPVADSAGADPQWGARIAAARATVPQTTDLLRARAFRSGSSMTLVVEGHGAALNPALKNVAFLSANSAVDPQAFVAPQRHGSALIFAVKESAYAEPPHPAVLPGVLLADADWAPAAARAVAAEIPVTEGPMPAELTGATPANTDASAGLAGILGLAFVGGLILNLMPCVFPVLGIKILGFVQQAGEDARKVKRHGLAFAAGVLVSFWVLAGMLILLRAGGTRVGWGYQLQVPGFVFVLAAVILIFALSLSGVFEIGGSLIGAGAGLQSKSGYIGSFFSGVLATVVATPCSAPFLGVALAGAVALPPLPSLLAFTTIAAGLALPYLLLSIFPHMVKVLPRPGAWMETFKQFMAFPLYATAAYLLWVLAGQLQSDYGLLFGFLGLLLIAMAAWVIGRWAAPHREPRTRWIARLAALALLGAGLALGFPRAAVHDWEPWSAEAVAKLRAEKRVIYVDFTARWCVTCQANKAALASSRELQDEFARRNVARLKADWTNRDPTIAAEIQRLGRAAVPVDLIYLPGREEPILLPEVLTPGIVLGALKTAK